MTVVYPAVFHPEDGSYWVEFPDLSGCQTYGDSISDTLLNAREALSGYCAALLSQKKTLPHPSEIHEIELNDASAFVTLVDAKPADEQRAVKKTLSIPAWLNTLSEEAHAPYSQLLQDALEKYLNLV